MAVMHLLYFLFGLVLVGLNANASPLRTTYQAKIIKPDGYPLQAASVNFRFTILDPSASCVLYVEDFAAINMTDSAGLISFSLGSGVRSFPSSGTAATFANVFNNATTSYSCQTPGIYTPAPNDNRKVVMQFQDSNGWQTLPAMIINAVPYAMYAWKSDNSTLLNGKADSAFVQYSTIPTCTASQALQYNGASFQCITAGGGTSYTVTASDVSNALGYMPVNPSTLSTSYTSQASFTTVTSTVNSLGTSVTTLTSSVNALASSMSAITSSQWVTSGSAISYTAGSVGVGTNSPLSSFSVGDGTDNSEVITLNAQNFAWYGWYLGGVRTAFIQSSASEYTIYSQTSGVPMTFYTSSAERMRITASGSVGIGRTNPVTKLDVNGGLRISMESAACAVSYAGTLRYNTGSVEFCNGTNWTTLTAAGAAVTSLNGSTSATQTFAIGTTGSTPNISTNSGVHTINIPLASAGGVTAGLISNADYTNFANKIWSVSGTGVYYNSGNVGVGINNPRSKLNVVGSGVPGIMLGDWAGGTFMNQHQSIAQAPSSFSDSLLEYPYTLIGGNSFLDRSEVLIGGSTNMSNESSVQNIIFYTHPSKNIPLGNERMRIDRNGNVGIATNNPTYPLTVSGTIASLSGGFRFPDGTTQTSAYVSGSITSSQWQNVSANIHFSTGNVGVGTSSPTGRLNVVRASADTSQANAAVNIGSTVNPTSLSMGMYDSNYAWIQTFATPLYINALGNNTIFNRDGGNVGVGVEAPVAKLQVGGEFSAGSTQTLQGNSSNKRFLIGDSNSYLNAGGGSNRAYIFGHGNTIDTGGSGSRNVYVIGQGVSATSSRIAMGLDSEHFTILPSGNVGVGATNPGAKLEVGGQIKITGGSPAAGRFLASDASGLGTWTALTSTTVTTALGYTPIASGSITGSQWANITGGINYPSGYVGINAPTLKVPLSVNYDTNVYNASYLDIPTYAGAVIVASGAAETAANVTKPVLVLARQNQGSWLSVARFELGRHAVNGNANTQMNIKLSQSGISNEGDNPPTVMTLLSTGNVGIGSSTPSSKLTVAGTIESSTGGFKFPDGTTQTTAGGPIVWTANSNNNALYSTGTPGGVVIGKGAGGSSVNLWVTTNWGGNDPATNNTGTYNLGVGPGTLTSNTSGSNNTAVGSLAGIYNTTGQGNTALGTLAFEGLNGGTNTGSFNTALGYRALLGQVSGTAGSRNIAIGYNAGSSISNGSNNVIIGSNTGSTIATLSNHIIIADGSGNDRIHVDSTGKVGIGTDVPEFKIHIKDAAAPVMVYEEADTTQKFYSGVDGSNYFIRQGSTANNDLITLRNNGNFGIGVMIPTTKLQVGGQITPAADNLYALGDPALRFTAVYAVNGAIQTSDARQKVNIQNSDLGLEFINKLRPVSYNWKSGPDSIVHYGLIAQETEAAVNNSREPSSAFKTPIVDHDEKSDRYGLRYTELISPIIQAIKELYSDFLDVKAEVQQLKTENAELKQQNKAIKDYLCAKDPSAPICK